MLNADVLAAMMQAAVTAAIPQTALLDNQYAGGSNAFFKAMAQAIVTHIQTNAVVILPPHVMPEDPVHAPGKVL